MVKAEFIEPTDPRWRELLDRLRHDTYHRPEYAGVAAMCEAGRAVAFLATEGPHAFLAPLLMRSIPPEIAQERGWFDVASPYGYPAPIVTPGAPAGQVARFLAAFRSGALEQGIVSAFFRLHPLFDLPLHEVMTAGEVVSHGEVVYIDLAPPLQDLWRQTRADHRSAISRLLRQGYSVDIDDWSRLPEFVAIYRATMRRVSAADFYGFSDGYFAALRSALGSRLHLCCVVAPDRQVAAAGLFMTTDRMVTYHLAGTAEEHIKLAPSKLMVHEMRRWAKASGHAVLNLGGGLGAARDSLFAFKHGFSRHTAPFRTLRAIIDPTKYDALVAARNAGPRAGGAAVTFFPAYRAA